MTEQSNAELIDKLRIFAGEMQNPRASLMRDAADALEAADQRAKDAVSQRNRAYRQRGEEREAKEGNIRALNRVTGERDQLAAALEAAEQEKAEAWRVAAEQTRLERERAEAAEQRAAEEERQRRLSQQAWAETLSDRNQYAAVVEKVRGFCADLHSGTCQDVLDILASAPADALRERDAEKWGEGAEMGHRLYAEPMHVIEARNPYREEQA